MSRARGVSSAPDARVAVLAAVAGLLLLGGRPAGLGQTAGPRPVRVVRPVAAQAVDGGYQPVARPRGPRPAVTRAADGAPQPPRYVPGQVIVKYKPSAASGPARLGQRPRGARAAPLAGVGGADLLALAPGADPEAVARALAARPDVEYAQPSWLRQPLFVPDDPYFAQQWNLAVLDMPRAWDINAGANEEVIVAVIDTGVAFMDVDVDFDAGAFTVDGQPYPALGVVTVPFAAAPDLNGPNRFVAPFDFVWGDAFPLDADGHGTHVAGTVGQLTDNGVGVAGVAFNTRIMPLKVISDPWDFIFGAVDVCCGATDVDVARAIRYAVQHGARVINLSLGAPSPSPVVDEALRYAVGQGAFIAIAAGNEFGFGNVPIYPGAAADAIAGAMAVGAVDRRLGRASYSSVGDYVEIAAPGGDSDPDGGQHGGVVLQQTLDYGARATYLLPPRQFGPPRFDVMEIQGLQGTSMAAPHVAGLAALLMTQGIGDPAAIEAAIKQFAVDLGPPGRDAEFGYGLIDPPATLRGLGLAR